MKKEVERNLVIHFKSGFKKYLPLSKAVMIKLDEDKQMLNIEKLKDGTFRMIWSDSLIDNFKDVISIDIDRPEILTLGMVLRNNYDSPAKGTIPFCDDINDFYCGHIEERDIDWYWDGYKLYDTTDLESKEMDMNEVIAFYNCEVILPE